MKKLACLLLTLVLVCASVAALAESKSTDNLTNTNTNTNTNNNAGTYVDPAPVFTINVASNNQLTVVEKQLVEDTLAKIADAADPITFFGDAVKAKIETLFPGVSLEALQLNELTAITVSDFSVIDGPQTINCAFPTKYTVGKTLIVLVGVQNADEIAWEVFAGTALADGSVDVTLPTSLLLSIQNGTAVIAVLND